MDRIGVEGFRQQAARESLSADWRRKETVGVEAFALGAAGSGHDGGIESGEGRVIF
jgi:hypothetical protein